MGSIVYTHSLALECTRNLALLNPLTMDPYRDSNGNMHIRLIQCIQLSPEDHMRLEAVNLAIGTAIPSEYVFEVPDQYLSDLTLKFDSPFVTPDTHAPSQTLAEVIVNATYAYPGIDLTPHLTASCYQDPQKSTPASCDTCISRLQAQGILIQVMQSLAHDAPSDAQKKRYIQLAEVIDVCIRCRIQSNPASHPATPGSRSLTPRPPSSRGPHDLEEFKPIPFIAH